MNILVCIKRVPLTGGKISLTADAQEIDTRLMGFTISPHEECAVEEAVRLVENHGGAATVLTLGPADATEQLRDAMSIGVERALHLETDGREFDPVATTNAIVDAIRAEGANYDMLLFGNEAADTGDYQIGVRVAYALGLPCVTGVKEIQINGVKITAKRQVPGGWEIFETSMPAVITVKEGINLPRYPSLPGRLKAKKKPIAVSQPTWQDGGLQKIKLLTPPEEVHQVEILGQGPEAAPKVVDLLAELGLL